MEWKLKITLMVNSKTWHNIVMMALMTANSDDIMVINFDKICHLMAYL